MKKIPRSSKLQCAFCQGKGVQPGAERLSCIVCGGSGRVTVRQPHNMCKECEGMGKKEGTNLYCLSCHGKGFVEESRYSSIAKPPVSKTKKKIVKRSKNKFRKRKYTGKSMPKARKAKTMVKKGRKSFFKGLLETFKIL